MFGNKQKKPRIALTKNTHNVVGEKHQLASKNGQAMG